MLLSLAWVSHTSDPLVSMHLPPSLVLLRGWKGVSIPYPLMGSKDMRTMLNFAYTLCSSAMFVSGVLGVGYGQVFFVQCLLVLRVAPKHGLV